MLSYAVEQRMRLIDFLLANFGYAARRHLVDYFGISEPAASRDLTDYEEMFPGNMRYSASDKCHLATETFKRVYP